MLNYPPKLSVALLVKQWKGASSRYTRQQRYASIQQKLWGSHLWSPSYFPGSCGGRPLEVIRQYIEQQDTPHSSANAVPPCIPALTRNELVMSAAEVSTGFYGAWDKKGGFMTRQFLEKHTDLN